jgi:Methyltransferase domain
MTVAAGESYLGLLARLHAFLKPRTYVEIGVWEGESLRLARRGTTAIGIDPYPRVTAPLPGHIRVFQHTSDRFFEHRDLRRELGGRAVELAFIDGMHQFEFVLRDFMHLEACSARNALILIHDCYPRDEESSERTPRPGTDFWTGDVWRALVALRRHRSDLDVVTLACPPSGVGLVRNLDSDSDVLRVRYEQIVEEMLAYDFSSFERAKDTELNLTAGDWPNVKRLLEESDAPARSKGV